MRDTIIAACGQFRPEFGESRGNIAAMVRMVEASPEVNLMVFPELATSGYEFRDKTELNELALHPVDSPALKPLLEAAVDLNAHIVFGFPERGDEGIFNSAALAGPDGGMTIYRKIHLFDREKNLFTPGDKPPSVVETRSGLIGLMICFDWIFPETARLLALGGAQIICHPSNLILDYCQQAMYARSVENGVFTMTCNRYGTESRADRSLVFSGRSQILSNRGKMLAQADKATEEVITAEIRPADADDKLITTSNHLMKDRRTSLYGQLVE